MLLKYNVSNFKSIGHPIEFSMFPTQANIDERYLKTIKTKAGDWKVLRRGGLFGPNASGKSSFVESLAFARDFIVEGQKSGKGTGINQFKGNFDDLNGISIFQFMFLLDEEVYEYGFSLNQRQIFEEWLMILNKNDFEPLFVRNTDVNGKTQIDVETELTQGNDKELKLAEVLKESIQENQKNQLFLYKLHDNGVKRAEDVVEWFNVLQVIFPETKIQGLPFRMQKDVDFKTFIANSLRNMDTGVFDVSVASKEVDFLEIAERDKWPKEIIGKVQEIKNGIVSVNGKYFIFSEGKHNYTEMVQVQFGHLLNGEVKNFDTDEESDGTQRLLDLLPILFVMGEKSHAIYFVDEIDRSLHTKLSQHLLTEFVRNCEKNHNQIIFTAHDVNLINLNDFRQDEIWFIEKNKLGESQLKPLSDFEVQKGQDTLKAYLSGRFGAIPMIRREL